MGLEPTENPSIQETLEEMGEIENEEIEEKWSDSGRIGLSVCECKKGERRKIPAAKSPS